MFLTEFEYVLGVIFIVLENGAFRQYR